MLKYSWNEEKNKLLKQTRGIGFQEVVDATKNKQILAILKHTNPRLYKNQKLMIININNYAYCAPFVEQDNIRFLKTIYPSRKYTNLYIKNKGDL